jgi:undecaprenyl-diphosphatase
VSVLVVLVGVALAFGTVVGLVLSRLPGSPAVPVAPATVGQELRRIERLRPALRRRTDPTKATGLALTLALAGVVGGGVGVGVVLVMVREKTGLADFDRWMAQFGADHATRVSTDVLKAVTDLGSTVGVVVIALLVAAFEWRRLPNRSIVPFLVVVVGGQSILSNSVKALVDRARPNIHPLASFASTSFPSGHTTAAAASYAAFALVLSRQRSRRTQTVIVGVAAALAGAVGTSRILLGVHWLTDVVAGLALGWGWFALCAIAFGGRLLRFGAPVEVAEREEAIEEAVDEAEHEVLGPPPPTRLSPREQREPAAGHPEPGATHEHTHR